MQGDALLDCTFVGEFIRMNLGDDGAVTRGEVCFVDFEINGQFKKFKVILFHNNPSNRKRFAATTFVFDVGVVEFKAFIQAFAREVELGAV